MHVVFLILWKFLLPLMLGYKWGDEGHCNMLQYKLHIFID